jgi:hypothetical protein
MAGPPERGHTSFRDFALHLSIYRWSGGLFASQLSLAIGAMTRVTSARVVPVQW